MKVSDDELAYRVQILEYAYYIGNQGFSLVRTLRLVLGDEIGFYSIVCYNMYRMPK